MPSKRFIHLLPAVTLLTAAFAAHADTLHLRNGTVMENCYIRDEGVRLRVWTDFDRVGTPDCVTIGRNEVAPGNDAIKIERDDASWDAHPDRADLTITNIEMSPKLAGLHGQVDYDQWGRPWITGAHSDKIPDLGEDAFLEPEKAIENLKLAYTPGEEITFTAHVRNIGFATAEPFDYEWLIDGQRVAQGACSAAVAEMDIVTFTHKWAWQNGRHTVTFRIVTDQPEIATINNTLTDALWALPYTYVVSNGRVGAWHGIRSAYGTFSFEDYYRWHLDIMNLAFEKSIYPASPDGIRARVRLDRIVYADQVRNGVPSVGGQPVPLTDADGIRCDAGGWTWNDSDEEIERSQWNLPTKQWCRSTEWSLPHELGHQLGLVDWYALDYQGGDTHLWPDNGAKIAHFMTHPETMMHWHGPQVFSEADAGYLNRTWNKPRGFFGDLYFGLPAECFLLVEDINGRPVPGAQIRIFQRGVVVDPNGTGGTDQGVQYFDVLEDGNFDYPVSADPVIVGQTDASGILRLPNRPAKEVRTLNGYHRVANPFGNINVVGGRALLLVEVSRTGSQPGYFYLEGHDFVVAWHRGQQDHYTSVLRTTFGSVDSPPAPLNVQVTPIDDRHVKLTWEAPPAVGDYKYTYLENPVGYRIYRRVGDDSENDRPWFAVGLVSPGTQEYVVDLAEKPEDLYWFGQYNRWGVTTVATNSRESELARPEQPLLRAPARTRDAEPVVEVFGVGPQTPVQITDGRTVCGTRVGNGAVRVTGLKTDGSYELRAVTPTVQGAPVTLLVDRAAEPPTVAPTGENGQFLVTVEPSAEVQLWWGNQGSPRGPLGGVTAGTDGHVVVASDPAAYRAGWVVRGFDGDNFDTLVYTDTWGQIDRMFNDGQPDPRLPADHFSYICDGYLQLDEPTRLVFEVENDDGARVFLNERLVIDNWGHGSMRAKQAEEVLGRGVHHIEVQYNELDGWAGLKFRYGAPGDPLTPNIPVRRCPLPTDRVELYVSQTDALGNASPAVPLRVP